MEKLSRVKKYAQLREKLRNEAESQVISRDLHLNRIDSPQFDKIEANQQADHDPAHLRRKTRAKKNKEVLYTLFMILCLGVFLFSGYQLLKIYFDYHQMEKEHLDLSNEVIQIVEETIEKEEIIEKKETINVDFTTLKQRNQDVVGWLYQKDTVINYPVVKCEDNETYVRKDLDKKYSRAGTLFVDFRCNEDVILIYGHHMLDGSMLASILDYQTQNYYDQHPEMIYCTLQKQYRVELFLGFVTTTEDELYTLQNLDWINERTSDFQTENQYKGGKLLILSTCYKQTGNERYILVGNLIEED